MANCIFCAVSVPPTFSIVNGKVIKVKNGNGNATVNGTPLQLEDGGDLAVHDEIKAFFVLKNILKISNEVLCELLSLCDGDSCPEHWVNVCEECGEWVNQFYDNTKNILKLERRLWDIDRGLRWRIHESNRSNEDGGGPIWKRIRSEAVKGFSFEDVPNDEPIPVDGEDHLHQEGQQVEENSSQNSVQIVDLEKEAHVDSFPSTPERHQGQGPFESSDDDDDVADNDKDSGYLGSTSSGTGTKKVNEKTGRVPVEKDKGDNQNNLNGNINGESNRLEVEKEKEPTQNEGGGGASSSSTSQEKSAIFVDLVTDDEEEESGIAQKSAEEMVVPSTSRVLVSCLKTSKTKDKRKTFKKKSLKNGRTATNKGSSILKSSSSAQAQEVQVRRKSPEIRSEAHSAELGEVPPVQNQAETVAPAEVERCNFIKNPTPSFCLRPSTPRPPPPPPPILIDLADDDEEEEEGTPVTTVIPPESSSGSLENGNPGNNELEQVRNETESTTKVTHAPTTTTSFPPDVQEKEPTPTSTSAPPCIENGKDKEDKTDQGPPNTQEETVVTFPTEINVTDNNLPSNIEDLADPPNSSEASPHVADNCNGNSSEIPSELLNLQENQYFQNVLIQPIGGTQKEAEKEGTSILLNLLPASEEPQSSENLPSSSSPQHLSSFEGNGGDSEINTTQSEAIVIPLEFSSLPGTPSVTLNQTARFEAQIASIVTNFMQPPEISTEFAQAPHNFPPPQLEPLYLPQPTLPIVPPPDANVPPLVVPPPSATIVNDVDSNLNLLALVTLEEAGLDLNQQPNLTQIPTTLSQVQIQSSTFTGDSFPILFNGEGSIASGNEVEQTSCPSTISTLRSPMVLSFNGGVVADEANLVQSETNGIPPEILPTGPTKPKKLFLIRRKPKELPLLDPAPPVEEAIVFEEETPVASAAAAATPSTGAPILLEIAEQKRPAILRKNVPKDLTSANLPPLSPPKKGKPKSYYVPRPKHSTSRKNWREETAVFMCHLCKYKTRTTENLERHLNLHTKAIYKDQKAAKNPSLAESATLFLLPRQAPTVASVSQLFNQKRNVLASAKVSSAPPQTAQPQVAPPPTAPPQMAPTPSAPPQTAPPQMVPPQTNLPLLIEKKKLAQKKPETPYILEKSGSKTLFKCQMCPAIKTSLIYMETHLKLHSGSYSNYVFCETCNYPLLPEKLEQHRSIRHPSTHLNNPNFPLSPFKKKYKQADYKCGYCPATFSTSESMDIHLKLHSEGSTAIVCPEPGCGWHVLRERMTHHQGRRHPENHAKCVPCNQRFFDDFEHQEHLRLHEIGQFCDKCGWLGKSLTQHNAWHHAKKGAAKGESVRGKGKQNESPEPSSPSSSASSSPPTTTENVEKVAEQENTPETNWKCGKCPSEFSTETALQEHEKEEHGDLNANENQDDDGRVECDVCGWWAKNLVKHKAKYHPPKGIQGNEIDTPAEAEASSSSRKKREVKRKQKADDDEDTQEEGEVGEEPKKKVKLTDKEETKVENKKRKPGRPPKYTNAEAKSPPKGKIGKKRSMRSRKKK
ncbi:unnamed protein product [Orchesella dallaii]|uniref:C2H2-type domain-containing protein n=1 Tax=Orchesella dallaii TaxID=48710 RepID=A0ABP1S4D3_9HEXA